MCIRDRYISLVNLIANREVVKELVADTMTVEQVRSELTRILYDKEYRRQMLEGYEYMACLLYTSDADSKQIIDFLEGDMLGLHFVPDGVDEIGRAHV